MKSIDTDRLAEQAREFKTEVLEFLEKKEIPAKIAELKEKLSEQVKKNPVPTLLAVAAAGFILGKILKR